MKNYIGDTWRSLSTAGRIILGIWILCLIALVVFLIVRNNNDEDSKTSEDNNTPEIAQVYEPSIGSPLPPDVPAETNWDNADNAGNVAGTSTTTPSNEPTTILVAPNAGVNPNEPIPYQNDVLKFAVTLPAGAKVSEEGNKIVFTNKNGSLLFIVSTQPTGTDTLETIKSQLSNSPSVNNISYSTFSGKQSLKFAAKEYGTGTVFIANGKVYYLLGTELSDFKVS